MADSIEHGTASDVAMQTANSALGRSLMVPSSTESRRAVADALLEYQDSWHVLFPWMRRSVSKAATETAIDETTNVLLLRAKRALCSRNAKAVLDAQIENLRGRIRIGLQHNDTVPYAQDLRNTLTECIELRLLFRDNISQVRDDDVLRALDYVKNSRLQGKDNLARIELLPAAARAFSDSITELLSAGTQHVGKITPDIVYRVYFPSVFGYTPSQQFFNDLVAGLRSRGWNRAAGLITGARGNTFLPISNFGGDCKTLRKMATLTTENGAELVSDSDRLRVLLFDTEHAFRGLESHTTAIATLDSYADPTVLRQLAMKRAKDISKPVMKDFGVKDPFGQIEFDWASTYHRPFYKNIGYFCAPYYRICRETVMFVPKVCTNVIKAGYETVVGWSKTAKNFRDRLTTKIGDSPSVGFLKGAAKGVVGTLQTITANAAWYWLEDYSPFDMWDLARADAKKAEDAFYAKKSIEAGYTKEDIEAGKDMRGKDMRVDAEATLVNTQTFLKAAGTEVTDALLIRSPLVKTKYGARYLLFKAVDRLIIWNTDGRSNALSLLLTDPTSVAEDVKAKYQEYRGKNLTGKRLEEQRKADEASKEAEDKNVKSEPEAAIKRADVVPWPSGTVHPGTNPQIFPYSEKAGDTLVFAVQVEVEGKKKWLFSREAGGLIHFTTNIPRNAVRSPAALELRSFLQDNLHLESVISPTEWSRRKNDILKKVAEKPSLRDIKISAIEWKSEKDIFHDLLRGEGIACIGEKKTDGGHSVYFYPNIRENQHTI